MAAVKIMLLMLRQRAVPKLSHQNHTSPTLCIQYDLSKTCGSFTPALSISFLIADRICNEAEITIVTYRSQEGDSSSLFSFFTMER